MKPLPPHNYLEPLSEINDRRADLGEIAISAAGDITNVTQVEDAATAIADVLAYIAHFCIRAQLDPADLFASGLRSFDGDREDGDLPAPIFDGQTHRVDGTPLE